MLLDLFVRLRDAGEDASVGKTKLAGAQGSFILPVLHFYQFVSSRTSCLRLKPTSPGSPGSRSGPKLCIQLCIKGAFWRSWLRPPRVWLQEASQFCSSEKPAS